MTNYDTNYWSRLIEDVVDEAGHDYVYPRPDSGTCQYQVYDTPDGGTTVAADDNEDEVEYVNSVEQVKSASCLVGRVLWKHGENTGRLDSIKLGLIQAEEQSAAEAFLFTGVEAPSEVIEALSAAQNKQDTGNMYGDVLVVYYLSLVPSR